jgi:hypothetical protein
LATVPARAICFAAVLAAVAAFAGSAGAAGYASCGGSYNVTGAPSKTVPFYKRIQARRVNCAVARSVTRSWIKRSYGRTPARSAVDSRGHRWGCAARFHAGGTTGEYQTVKCARRGGKRVRFRGSP